MIARLQAQPVTWPRAAWLTVAFSGIIAPAAALVTLANAPAPLALLATPILAVGLMGAGIIGAAVAGRLGLGFLFALASGGALVLLALALGMSGLAHPLSVALVVCEADLGGWSGYRNGENKADASLGCSNLLSKGSNGSFRLHG